MQLDSLQMTISLLGSSSKCSELLFFCSIQDHCVWDATSLKSNKSASCASDLFFIGYSCAHPEGLQNTCAHLFFLCETTCENIVSVNIVVHKRLYRSCRLFVRNHLKIEGFATVQIPLCRASNSLFCLFDTYPPIPSNMFSWDSSSSFL